LYLSLRLREKEILKEISNKVLSIMLGSSRNEIADTKENHIKKNNLIFTVASSVMSIIRVVEQI
jgi:hypothetical protein